MTIKNNKYRHMKRLLLFFTILFSLQNFAQTIEITPIYGYTFSGESNYYYNFSLDITDDVSYGGILSVEVAPQTYAEFMYQTTDASMRFKIYSDPTTESYDARFEHFQLGSLREFKTGDLRPFLKASLGATHYRVRNANTFSDDSWEFSGSIGGGVKKFFNDRVGIRLQTNLILPMRWSGGGVYCGPYGCSGGTSFHVPLVHWEVSGGLIVKMGD